MEVEIGVGSMSRVSAIAMCFTALGVAVASVAPAWAVSPDPGPRGQKADFGYPSVPDPGPRGQKSDFGSVPDPGPRGHKSDYGPSGTVADSRQPNGATGTPDPTMPPRAQGRQAAEGRDTEELTVDAAMRAIDAFAAVRDKYTDAGLENYDSLEAFVAETEAGKRLEADIMAHGFADITDWNDTITAVAFAYTAFVYDYAADLRQQIRAVRDDPTIDDEMRAQLIAGLNGLMPSRNNRIVMQSLFRDQAYRDKLRLLEEEE
jgi:hypothetical protein